MFNESNFRLIKRILCYLWNVIQFDLKVQSEKPFSLKVFVVIIAILYQMSNGNFSL